MNPDRLPAFETEAGVASPAVRVDHGAEIRSGREPRRVPVRRRGVVGNRDEGPTHAGRARADGVKGLRAGRGSLKDPRQGQERPYSKHPVHETQLSVPMLSAGHAVEP